MAVEPRTQNAESGGGMIAEVERALALSDTAAATHVFATRFDAEARLAALAMDKLHAEGGAARGSGPITIKHNIDVVGQRTLAGSPARKDVGPARADAEVVRRLRRRGYIVLGHTNMTELAFSGLGINPTFGTARNPAFTDERIPGGSSAGAAVSVALGIVRAAIGTDTGGSVRIPAAMCGVVGFKPTAAAISQQGVVPLSESLDAVGIIADTVSSCAGVLEAARGRPRARSGPLAKDLRSLRLGAVQDYVLADMDGVVANAYDRALQALSDAGAAIVRCDFPELRTLPELNRAGTFAAAESFARFGDLIRSHGAVMDPEIVRRIEAGAAMSAAAYINLLKGRRALVAAGRRRARGLDALMMPTIPIIAPRFAELTTTEDFQRLNLLVLRNPSIVNVIDGCAISVPCNDSGEPPVGLTLAHVAGRDDELLGVAAAVETVLRVRVRTART
jgi:aspartyl-tRNA(Asn)/glutamyl-tRNA(Gln) amidotransferase subunit A